ncbi:MAG TPA: glycosyltransferase family 9 protein [Patescibacteria group bacterium]|nr:glycosyltransferase family 9 protein [Patescibacteria group bacterium]
MNSPFPTTVIFTKENHPSNLRDPYIEEQHQEFSENSQNLDTSFLRKKLFGLLGRTNPKTDRTKKLTSKDLRQIVIFRYDAIGDYIVSSPIMRWLHEAYPNVSVDVVTSYRNDVMAKIDPFVRESFAIHPGHNFHPSWFSLMKKLRPKNYDVVLGLVFTRMTKCAILARGVAPNAEKITLMHRNRRQIYGLVFPRQTDHEMWREHWAETMLRVVTENFEPEVQPSPKAHNPYIVIDEKSWSSTEAVLKSHGLHSRGLTENLIPGKNWQNNLPEAFDGEPYCVVNISAHTQNRQWSFENALAVCRGLLSRFKHLKIFLGGSPDDTETLKRIEAALSDNRCSYVPMKLAEFIAFVANATVVITPDTATLHMAAAAQVPVVGLYAEYIKVAEWYPYKTEFALVLSRFENTINAIEPEKVLEACEILLEKTNTVLA